MHLCILSDLCLEFDREQRRKASGREPLGEGERQRIEQLVSQALQLPEAAQAGLWGAALGYGRDAEAVIRVNDGIEHGYESCGHPIAVKLYRCRKPKFVHWHAEQFKQMPGFL
ncbi:MAG: hypothetical protein HYY20_08920 [Candidatus Tectomicrobia bacterium]|uniref:Uncharacterized protein n=1 Tax=Tectimicrobiota bacterium TaxID=2528274 RepID=A0A932FZ08_UNCTE|nr:hypothetical protein [Candidatus Tectomicrobia bacterium]